MKGEELQLLLFRTPFALKKQIFFLMDIILYKMYLTNQMSGKYRRKVDYLITEGTMMGERKDENIKKESALYDEAKRLFKENRYVFLVISSTNLDSLVSFYHAALDNEMFMYCYNYYFYKQLKTFSKAAGERSPWYRFEDIYTINFEKQLNHKLWDKDKTQEAEG